MQQFPKFVAPHTSRIARNDKGVSVHGFPEGSFPESARAHVQRGTGKVTVLVRDAAEERVALSPMPGFSPVPAPAPAPAPPPVQAEKK